ncbi:CDP-glycerol glycerophosphotransferase family protein [Photobacterium gaetbulicola]|uniref:Putative CDP-glycerol:poly(Glycerophosphate) glycerophosphotransferase n=1 Tax=Photobacterium gaetbulicola Gung47 TaxID=658445 RepID=A0A0C5WCT7_9GAMM|nr:CDP-glycerol glycerophosphotransferase family protein [Photobacterium gaetbulicola]AJR09521.1 putative CDP-glycerol:poly(glycerophosphate) glycerophosphotransferase [Photobacterium gaetbulicola Gung47]PSU14316.1 CDP-glycerol glycerophosphotransferase family protein [Photobacterium gaetbulicola]
MSEFLTLINSFAVIFLLYIFRRRIKILIAKKSYSYFKKLPVNGKRAIFSSFSGKAFSDSPKYLYLECQQKYPDIECIWVVDDLNIEIPGNATKVKNMSFKHFYYMATSKYWIFNARIPAMFTKREEHVYLQTWHGTPLKKLGLDMDVAYFATANYKHNFYKNAQRWDYLVSANSFSSKVFPSAFGVDKDIILEYGYPRNDILINHTENDIAKIKKDLKLDDTKKVILYCPTWRDDQKKASKDYGFNLKMDLKSLKDKFGSDAVILLRMHYLIAENIDLTGVEDFAFDVSNYPDIQELYIISDVMITDYSSTMFDYSILKKPVILYTYDLDKYKDVLRGFYFDLLELSPGPIVIEQSELENKIEKGLSGELNYNEAFYNKFCLTDKGTASQSILEKLFLN